MLLPGNEGREEEESIYVHVEQVETFVGMAAKGLESKECKIKRDKMDLGKMNALFQKQSFACLKMKESHGQEIQLCYLSSAPDV